MINYQFTTGLASGSYSALTYWDCWALSASLCTCVAVRPVWSGSRIPAGIRVRMLVWPATALPQRRSLCFAETKRQRRGHPADYKRHPSASTGSCRFRKPPEGPGWWILALSWSRSRRSVQYFPTAAAIQGIPDHCPIRVLLFSGRLRPDQFRAMERVRSGCLLPEMVTVWLAEDRKWPAIAVLPANGQPPVMAIFANPEQLGFRLWWRWNPAALPAPPRPTRVKTTGCNQPDRKVFPLRLRLWWRATHPARRMRAALSSHPHRRSFSAADRSPSWAEAAGAAAASATTGPIRNADAAESPTADATATAPELHIRATTSWQPLVDTDLFKSTIHH